jgi:hypothetical protein
MNMVTERWGGSLADLKDFLGDAIPMIAGFLGDVIVVLIAAGALLTFALSQLAATRDRQRQEYAKALQSAVKWTELPYRIRRRDVNDGAAQARLVEAIHELQEDLAFHDAWLSVEAPEVAAAYKGLIEKVKSGTSDHIKHAWAVNYSPPVPMNIGACYDVECEAERSLYVAAVRYHLRWWGLWRRMPILKRWGRPNVRVS